jgi:hypothetical protein
MNANRFRGRILQQGVALGEPGDHTADEGLSSGFQRHAEESSRRYLLEHQDGGMMGPIRALSRTDMIVTHVLRAKAIATN